MKKVEIFLTFLLLGICLQTGAESSKKKESTRSGHLETMLADKQGITTETLRAMQEKNRIYKKISMLQQIQDQANVNDNNTKRTTKDSSNPYLPFDPDRGYIDIYNKDNSMWYWHFRSEKDPETAPLVLWFQGGPGGASTNDVFNTNGPFLFHDWPKGGIKAKLRKISWNQIVNIVYIDFPLGVGFSTVTTDGLSLVAEQVQDQILIFFLKFLKKYPEYKKRQLYIAGVSYGGHWVPYVTSALKYAGYPDINVQGMYISDGYFDGYTSYQSYFPFGLKYSNYTKFTQETVKEFSPISNLCLHLITTGKNKLYVRNAWGICFDTYDPELTKYTRKIFPKYNPYFMPGFNKTTYPELSFNYFLNNTAAQKFLGVRKTAYLYINLTFLQQFGRNDFFVDAKPYMARLLDDGVKLVHAVGELDFITNYFMSEKVISEIKWKWQNEYNAVQRVECSYGMCKQYKNLWEVRVKGSGHGISLFKPAESKEIINTLINWKPNLTNQ